MRRVLFSLLLLLTMVISASAQRSRSIGVAYYNVDKLYDTIPSTFYDDEAYTPQGKLRWDGEKYERKISNIAQVLDSMRMPIVMLYGVENE
ncbi:MAG: hypothetical protein II226_00520, partial [Alistipes sp.]|nr:hypothetical protein [Alistipes sp.]